MDYCDITVVVQGPVQTFQDRPQEANITQKCMASIREHLPGAHIILSTWPDQDLTGLDYDEIVISDDPGVNVRNYTISGEPQKYNNNRQIVSSREGLKKVKTPYAIKIRSDNYLTGNDFVELQKKYYKRSDKYKFFNERVVVSNTFTRQYAKGFPVAFHISDFFYYGRTEDVLALWDIPLFEDFQPSKVTPINDGFPNFVIDCTQALFISAIKKFDHNISLDHLLDNRKYKIIQSEKIIANNLIVASPEQIGLGLCQKFLGKARISRRSGQVAMLQFFEWQKTYQLYCDSSLYIDDFIKNKINIYFFRLLYVYPNRIQTKFKVFKRKMKNLKN